MDVMVRPVTSSSCAVNVSFSLTVWALVDLVRSLINIRYLDHITSSFYFTTCPVCRFFCFASICLSVFLSVCLSVYLIFSVSVLWDRHAMLHGILIEIWKWFPALGQSKLRWSN